MKDLLPPHSSRAPRKSQIRQLPKLKETIHRSRENILEYSHPATSPPANLPSSLACESTIRSLDRGSTPPARTEKEDTSAHRAEYNGTMSTPLLPPPALTAWSRTATSASVPIRHIAATSPPTQKCNTQGGSGAKAVVHETQARQAPSRRQEVPAETAGTGALPRRDGLSWPNGVWDVMEMANQRERAHCPRGTASRDQMDHGMSRR